MQRPRLAEDAGVPNRRTWFPRRDRLGARASWVHDERSLVGLGKDMLKKSVGIGLVKDVKQGSEAAKMGAEMLAQKDQMLAQAAELQAASQAGMASGRAWRCRGPA